MVQSRAINRGYLGNSEKDENEENKLYKVK